MSLTAPELLHAGKMAARGIASGIPGVLRLAGRAGTGGTSDVRYCYDVWIKHLALLHGAGMARVPERVAEIGPGDSLGVGVAALLCGARVYRALDVVAYSSTERSLAMVDGLVELLRARARRAPGSFPDFDHLLDANGFPAALLSDEWLGEMLRADRIEAVRAAVAKPGVAADGIELSYAVPWTEHTLAEAGPVDLVYSHAVLEHVVDLAGTYAAMKRWLNPGGWMSHQVDFGAHGLALRWNGHRAYGETLWKLIVGGRPFLINREPPSVHLGLIEAEGFIVHRAAARRREGGIAREQLAPRWRDLTDADLDTDCLFVQAMRPATTGSAA